MARLGTIELESATGKAREVLSVVKSKLGLVPNMLKVMANSPAVADSYVQFSSALAQGSLSAGVRELIAITVAQGTSCAYCLSAHTAIGKGIGLAPADLSGARTGEVGDAKVSAALRFARVVVDRMGGVTDADVAAVKRAGWTDGEVAEIIGAVGLNLFTNLFNKAAGVEVDFPRVDPARAS